MLKDHADFSTDFMKMFSEALTRFPLTSDATKALRQLQSFGGVPLKSLRAWQVLFSLTHLAR